MKRFKRFCIGIGYLVFAIFLVRDIPVIRGGLCSVADVLQPGSSRSYHKCPLDPPTSAYKKVSIRGFTVFVHPELHQNQALADEALQELEQSLEAIAHIVPLEKLSVLQKTVIWLELTQPKPPSSNDLPEPDSPVSEGEKTFIIGTYYHYSPKTLLNMGFNPDKATGVGIVDVNTFVQYSHNQQLRLVLHEMAHAYHHQVLGGERYTDVVVAYGQAVAQKLYESVEYADGGEGRAYALWSQFEYFAELSVVYFAQNEYYPFTRADLQKHDPVGYRLMQKVWGER